MSAAARAFMIATAIVLSRGASGQSLAAQSAGPTGLPMAHLGDAATSPSWPTGSICGPTLVPAAACFRSDHAARTLLHRRASDYRYEGLAIGAGIGVIGGILLGGIGCSQSDGGNESCAGDMLKGGLILGGLGGLAGLVIGGFIDKHPGTPSAAAPE